MSTQISRNLISNQPKYPQGTRGIGVALTVYVVGMLTTGAAMCISKGKYLPLAKKVALGSSTVVVGSTLTLCWLTWKK